MRRAIPLTRGQVAIVDDEDFERLTQFKWCAVPASSAVGFYAMRKVIRDGEKSTFWMHREVLQAPFSKFVDHRDGNGLHNWRGNLRTCSRALNAANSIAIRKATPYRGVYLRRNGKWQACITVDGRTRTLGTFADPVEAALARDRAALEAFGEFAVLNFSIAGAEAVRLFMEIKKP